MRAGRTGLPGHGALPPTVPSCPSTEPVVLPAGTNLAPQRAESLCWDGRQCCCTQEPGQRPMRMPRGSAGARCRCPHRVQAVLSDGAPPGAEGIRCTRPAVAPGAPALRQPGPALPPPRSDAAAAPPPRAGAPPRAARGDWRHPVTRGPARPGRRRGRRPGRGAGRRRAGPVASRCRPVGVGGAMPFPGGLWWLLCCRRGFTLLRRDYGEAEREVDGEAEEEEEASFELRAQGDQVGPAPVPGRPPGRAQTRRRGGPAGCRGGSVRRAGTSRSPGKAPGWRGRPGPARPGRPSREPLPAGFRLGSGWCSRPLRTPLPAP